MTRIFIAGGAFFLGVAILIAMAVREGGVPTVSADHVTSDGYQGEEVFLVVQVSKIQRMANPARFSVLDKDGGTTPLEVETKAVLSDTFSEGSDLRIKGTFDPVSEVFTATWVDTKCPSKYDGTREGGPSEYATPEPLPGP